jgi:hypothetical protein
MVTASAQGGKEYFCWELTRIFSHFEARSEFLFLVVEQLHSAHHAPSETPTSCTSACQCRGGGRRRPTQMASVRSSTPCLQTPRDQGNGDQQSRVVGRVMEMLESARRAWAYGLWAATHSVSGSML